MKKNRLETPIIESVAVKERGWKGGFRKSIQTRISAFATKGGSERNLTTEEAYAHLAENQHFNVETAVCTDYLTGKPINLLTELWALDHVDPTAGNIVSNMRITLKEYNMIKSNIQLETFIEDCESILRRHKPELFTLS